MPITLNDIELRVLGVLIEKALTHPAGYPLTLNAILLCANQKQNRDPVLDCTESQVASAVHSLELKKLVMQAPPAAGARANRFAHNVVDRLHWDRRQQAVMAELMLRGAQTGGELRSRASRMSPFQDLQSVAVTLAELIHGEPPFVTELPREPGKSVPRYRHRIAEEPPPPETPASVDTAAPDMPPAVVPESLENRVAKLEAQVARLAKVIENPIRNEHDTLDGPDSAPL